MKGVEFAEVRDAIARCFTADEFDMFLYERLDFDRPTEIPDGSFKAVVTNVLRRFESEGTDPFLIAEVAAARPLKAEMQEVYRKYAKVLIGDAQQGAIESARLKAMERYGLAPAVDLQSGGVSQLRRPASAANEGFQRQINKLLPALNIAPWAKGLFEQTARVCLMRVDGIGRGTGFLVGPDAVLTNYHVLKELIPGGAGDRVTCVFDYRQNASGQDLEGMSVGVATDWLIDASPPLSDAQEAAGVPVPKPDQLDYALVRLGRAFGSEPLYPGGPTRGWVRVPATAPELDKGMPVLILQHPHGDALKLALDTDAVLGTNANGTRVRYTTNTDEGSSGSPCFNLKWGLVALHHYGEPGRKIATYNQGVPIAAVLARLMKRNKAGALGPELA